MRKYLPLVKIGEVNREMKDDEVLEEMWERNLKEDVTQEEFKSTVKCEDCKNCERWQVMRTDINNHRSGATLPLHGLNIARPSALRIESGIWIPSPASAQDQNTLPDPTPSQAPQVVDSWICDVSHRPFASSDGLGQHMRKGHPKEANEQVMVAASKERWRDQEKEKRRQQYEAVYVS
ncbi:unnamed protein product [Trichogramma brassicae]|uniref:Uncharacterized protein n=1 Tax=Trichogramma brassicae TaxID=86971 RepID=A0A6H5IAC7_9HYME|nr:unnamed protein product [Trichogramma brassicae]